MNLLENRGFADVMKLRISRWDHGGFRACPKSSNQCHFNRNGQERETEGNEEEEAETEVMLQAKECKGMQAATRS